MKTQSKYQRTIKFAAEKHSEINQYIPGTHIPYVVHLSNVAMEVLIASKQSNEFNLNYAIQLALLHDTIEDTDTTYEELTTEFGVEVAEGVLALTKNKKLSTKQEQMQDSLGRIKLMSIEVSIVKLADRISNLQEPPQHWDNIKKKQYQQEAQEILNNLKGSNEYLETRLKMTINGYDMYIE
jgi:guanosine-3',5'-bis(diphosphate) 3'-pyrophosphohydrolase